MHSMLIIRECDVILKLVLRHQALKKYGIQLIAIEQNLIDLIWKKNSPRPPKKNLIVLDVIYSGKHIIGNIAALWSYHRTMLTLKKVCSHNEIFRSAWGKPFFRTVTTVSKRLSRPEISPTHSYSTQSHLLCELHWYWCFRKKPALKWNKTVIFCCRVRTPWTLR